MEPIIASRLGNPLILKEAQKQSQNFIIGQKTKDVI
jgi:hypothetical protein